MARAVVPLPEDLKHRSVHPPPNLENDNEDQFKEVDDQAAFFKEMLDAAESEEEQVLALQIALGQRLREIRSVGGDDRTVEKLEHALELLREGKLADALKCTAESMKQA
jgi:hypothetical protein